MDLHAVPDDFFQVGKEKNLNPQSIASFVDGTKTMLEMSILSNATGWGIDCPGMHGPKVNVDELNTTFVPKSAGGLLSKTPVIDYGVGNIAPGVFVIFTTEQQSIIDELLYLKMQGGPYFYLYKPYHLGNIEAPLSIHSILRDNRPSLVIKDKFVTMVCAKAKKDLKKGDVMDTSGGYTFYGFALAADDAERQNLAPLALVEKSTMARDVAADELISMDDIAVDEGRGLLRCWNDQKGMG
jgi:predicted homoserine dehydrogenase-like protein